MSSWWQTKLLPYGLRYILSKTGILEEKAQDIGNFNISVGKKNVIELKNVGLNIAQLSKYAKLPPCLRIETARILLLRLTIPADFFQSSILVEVEGIELVAELEEKEGSLKPRERSPTSTRTPSHRKTDRRLRSPPPYDPGGDHDADRDSHIPTTQEVAKSFLMEEPLQERRELEASVVATSRSLEDSFVSQSSDSDDVGTGVAVGVPGFLATFLQGLIDRLRVEIRNVEVKLETEIQGDTTEPLPVSLQLRVGSVEIGSLANSDPDPNEAGVSERRISVRGIEISLLADATVFADMSEVPSQSSRSESRHTSHKSVTSGGSSPVQEVSIPESPLVSPSIASVAPMIQSTSYHSTDHDPMEPEPTVDLAASVSTVDADRFADAGDEDDLPPGFGQPLTSQHDILMGDDNISWRSRKSQSSVPADDDLWKSMVSEENLEESWVPDRPSTPRAYSSRGSSPFATRLRRPQSSVVPSIKESPDQSFTGSLEDRESRSSSRTDPRSLSSHDRTDLVSRLRRQSPASHSHSHSHAQPSHIVDVPTALHTNADRDITDHRLKTLGSSTVHDEIGVTPDHQSEDDEDLAQSQLFDPDAAKSMYMSAMTSSPQMNIPGAWSDQSQIESSHTISHPQTHEFVELMDNSRDGANDSGFPLPGNETPRAQTPTNRQGRRADHSAHVLRASKQILNVDAVTICVPAGKASSEVSLRPTGGESPERSRFLGDSHMVPGTFSAYSERSSARFREIRPGPRLGRSPPRLSSEHSSRTVIVAPLQITIDAVFAQFDISTVRMLYCAATKAGRALQSFKRGEKSSSEPEPGSGSSPTPIAVEMKNLQVSLTEQTEFTVKPMISSIPSGREILTIVCGTISLSQSSDTNLRVMSVRLLLGTHELVAIQPDVNGAPPVDVPTDDKPAVSVRIGSNKFTTGNRSVTDVNIETLPIHLSLDLAIIEDTFSSFGGLSGVLELGTSILSETGASSPAPSPKLSKGVRFASETDAEAHHNEWKLNVRVSGLNATLRGPCAFALRTTTLRAVYRENAASATIEHVALHGLYRDSLDDASLSVELTTLRFDHCPIPPDKDLERLLSLLTPSKDKYDNDDDILVETLLRQRRKGGLLRAGIKEVRVHVSGWERFSELDNLGQELSKLSVVAKYLPEDDRPGLLILARISDVEILVPVNDRFGPIQISARNLNLAHVGLPALLAFSIETVNARRPGASNLLHPLNPTPYAEVLPMIMARMLGDEEVPTVKIKLFNLGLEYSVPIIMALTGANEDVNAEELVAEVVQSVANIAIAGEGKASLQRNKSGLSSASTKTTTIDLLVHDSGIGLNPQHLVSKALFVLSNVHVSTAIPPGEIASARISIRRAELYITDDCAKESEVVDTSSPVPSVSIAEPTPKLATSLESRGYISIGSMRSAEIHIKAESGIEEDQKSVEVVVRNELLLLETCADSTQTLFATLGDLAPPAPPDKQPKYLMEPMTIEDMMASFTGEPVEQSENLPETLFDAEDPDNGPDLLYDAEDSDREQPDDLLAESEMTSSLYGPVSGILGMDVDQDEGSDDGYQETAESLLEDDPFDMTISPIDMPMSDNELLRDLRKQCRPSVKEDPVDLGIWEVEDLGFDALGSGQQAIGTRDRFNAPFAGRSGKRTAEIVQKLPLTLKLRDVHIIWHLYDGYDWERTRQGIVDVVEQVERKAEERKAKRRQSLNEREEEESVIGDILFNSIYIGVPADNDAHELRRKINEGIDDQVSVTDSVPLSGISRPTNFSGSGQPRRPRQRKRLKLARSRSHKISFELKGVSADVFVYPPGSGTTLSTTDLRVKDFEIFDNVPSSSWRKFLTHLSNDPAHREMSKPMFHISIMNVKTLESHSASELTLEVAVLPLRLHVDQDALDFITRFFEFKDKSMVPDKAPAEQPFIQRLEVHTVDLRLDYKPKRVDYVGLRSGRTTEFMNFVTLDATNIRLNHAIVYGLRGFDAIHPTLNGIWSPDVTRNQLANVLAGVAAVRSLANVASGFRDVVAIPVREYKKDGRIVRSIQKGAFHFGKTTASELARLGAKVALGTQNILSNAEGFLSPAAASSSGRPNSMRRVSSEQGWQDLSQEDDRENQRAVSAYANQPLGLLAGLKSARRHLEHDLLTAKDAFIAVQGEIFDSGGPGGAAAAVAKHAPTVILRPVIGATRAIGTTLLGVGNQIDKSNMRRIDDKYKRR